MTSSFLSALSLPAVSLPAVSLPALSLPALADTAHAVVAWLLTYGIHSTLFLGLAWIASKRLPLAAEEGVWRLALVGGLLSATARTLLPGSALSWSTPAPVLDHAAATAVPALSSGGWNPAPAANLAATPILDSPAAMIPHLAWQPLLVATWAGVAIAGVALLAISQVWWRRRLADRRPVASGPAAEALRTLLLPLGRRVAPGLFASRRLPVPVARGWGRRGEICMPERALNELPAPQQESAVAHELAHLLRRDPLWQLAAAVLERVFFFQPLHRVARRRLLEIAEYRCDDWAAAHTGKPLDLARCLTSVASWHVAQAGLLPGPALAASGSRLGRRVRRLVEGPAASGSSSRWWLPASTATVVLLAALAPAITGAAPEAPPAPEAPSAPEAAPAPEAPPASEAPSAMEAPSAPVAPPAPKASPEPRPAAAPRVAPTPAAAPAPVVAPTPPTPRVPRVATAPPVERPFAIASLASPDEPRAPRARAPRADGEAVDEAEIEARVEAAVEDATREAEERIEAAARNLEALTERYTAEGREPTAEERRQIEAAAAEIQREAASIQRQVNEIAHAAVEEAMRSQGEARRVHLEIEEGALAEAKREIEQARRLLDAEVSEVQKRLSEKNLPDSERKELERKLEQMEKARREGLEAAHHQLEEQSQRLERDRARDRERDREREHKRDDG